MLSYALRRLFIAIPVFFLVTVMVFLFMHLSPGEPEVIAAVRGMSEEQAEQLRHDLKLDRPLAQQYFYWIGNMLQGDAGKSDLYNTSVTGLLKNRFPNTLRLGLMTLIIATLIGIPLGILSAVKANKPPDYICRGLAVLALAIPGFWLAILAIVVPAKLWGIAPSLSFVPWSESKWENFEFFLIPALLLGLHLVGVILRMTRSMMLEVLTSDYIRTARAKGLRETLILRRHALRNALIPIVTIIGTQAAWLIGGSVVIEKVFGIPGVGSLLVDSVTYKDFHIVQAIAVYLAAFVLVINLVVDVSYGFLDPRIRHRT